MPKKGTRKIFSQRQLHKQKQKTLWNRTQRQRERSRTAAREAKVSERFINANNTTHTVPFQTVKIETEPNEIVINEENDFETVNLPDTSPTELQILGLLRKGKHLQKDTRRLSNKQKQRLNFKQTRKQRQKNIQQARQSKQQERQMENAEENNLPNYVELDYNYYNMNNELEQMRRYQQEQMELERIEQEYQREQVRKAQKQYNKAEKNKFYFRSNTNELKKIHVLTSFFKYISQYRIHKLEFAYFDKDFNKSYCYLFKFDEEHNSNNNNHYYGYDNNFGYRRSRRRYGYMPSYHREYYDVYKKNPINVFRSPSSFMSFNYYVNENDPEYNTMGATYVQQIDKSDLRKFLRRLPFVKEKLAKEEAAKYTVPVKLKDLQMKAVDAAAQQFERKTGKYVPQNVQNIIEQMIKPIDYRYYQGRDNLQRIKTNLFQTQPNNGKERLRKINTDLFQE